MNTKSFYPVVVLLCAGLIPSTLTAEQVTLTPDVVALGWPVTLDLVGPPVGDDAVENPFRDIRLDVTFRRDDYSVTVPGYLSHVVDEGGREPRGVWRVHFVPEKKGDWRYDVSFVRGRNVGLHDSSPAAAPLPGHGNWGVFRCDDYKTLRPASRNGREEGMLRLGDGRYLRFSLSGRAWLKAGVDSPENLLAYAGFSNTTPTHQYAPHRQDFLPDREDTTLFAHARQYRLTGGPDDTTPADWMRGPGRSLLGAVDYLAAQGVNSMYMIPMNLAGDGKDVWPWIAPDRRDRFDLTKLREWNWFFERLTHHGMMIHFILTETENESFFEVMDGPGRDADVPFADTRKLYYRELIARFAHHPMVTWNLGEENGGGQDKPDSPGRPNTDAQRKAFATYIRDLDPYDHPIVVHTYPGHKNYEAIYTPLLGFPHFDGPSIQTNADVSIIYETTRRWIERSTEAGRPWFVCIDEPGNATDGLVPDSVDPDHDEMRRHALWGNLMAGGSGVEWYFGYKHPHNDLNLEDFRSRENMYQQTAGAVWFFQHHLPFEHMTPRNDLVDRDDVWCLAQPGGVHALYLPDGKKPTKITFPEGRYTVHWFNPRQHEPRATRDLLGGKTLSVKAEGPQAIGDPPYDPEKDWAVVIVNNAQR